MLFSGLGDAIALYPVYALLFGDTGLSTGQISTLLVFWSVTAMLLEVPSGALADRVSRHRLLAVAAVIRGVGFGLWVLVPSYPIFLLGFLLWSVQGALTSGTVQALVYEGLREHGATSRYNRLVGRAATAEMVGGLLATIAAAPLLALGGYELVGLASVSVCLVQAVLAWTWPRPHVVGTAVSETPRPLDGPVTVDRVAHRAGERAADLVMSPELSGRPGVRAEFAAYLATLREGLGEVWHHRRLRWLVLAAGLLPGLMGFDEYLPLLALEVGAERTWVPVLLAVPPFAMAVAGLLTGSRLTLWPAVPLLLSAVVIGAGAADGSVAGFVAIGLGLGAFHLTRLILEAAVQHAVVGSARATVTSVAGFLGEVSAVSVFLSVGVGAQYVPLGVAVTVNAVVIGLAALLLPLAIRHPHRPTDLATNE